MLPNQNGLRRMIRSSAMMREGHIDGPDRPNRRTAGAMTLARQGQGTDYSDSSTSRIKLSSRISRGNSLWRITVAARFGLVREKGKATAQ